MEPLSEHIASKWIDKAFLSSESFVWQPEVVYQNSIVKMWLSSPPKRSKNGTKYQFVIVNEVPAKPFFFEFARRVEQDRFGHLLFDQHEGTVEITLEQPIALLFDDFFLTLAQQNNDQNQSFLHPLPHYWRQGIVNVYY